MLDNVKQRAFEFVDRNRDDMIASWAALVNHESPSANKASVDGIAIKIRDMLAGEGAATRLVEFENAGNLLVATTGPERPAAPIALVGHYDTVLPIGTIRQRPFVVRDGKVYGPGVLDMKGGVVVLLYAVKALRVAGYDARPLKVILAGDEEVAHGRSTASDVIRGEAAGCLAAFNLETGYLDNGIVVGRKGGGTYTMTAHGVAAHTGSDPGKGRSAILELAHKIIDIHALTDHQAGTTFSVGTIKGGTTSNTTPALATMEIDVRYLQASAGTEIAARLGAIADRIHVDGTRTVLSGGSGFPPMETTAGVMRLFDLVARTSVENGFPEPVAIQSGGGSDSSICVAAGVPTVCAMGVKGGGNHTPDEYAVLESLYERCKLLIACIVALGSERS